MKRFTALAVAVMLLCTLILTGCGGGGSDSGKTLTLNVYNDDDYTEAPLMHEPFTVYPLAKASSADTASGDGTSADRAPAGEAPEGASTAGEVPADAATPFVREPAESDLILVDNADCQIVVTGFDPDNSWGYAVKLYLRNKTDQDLIFSADNTSVNGI